MVYELDMPEVCGYVVEFFSRLNDPFIVGRYAALASPSAPDWSFICAHAPCICGLLHNATSTASPKAKGLLKSICAGHSSLESSGRVGPLFSKSGRVLRGSLSKSGTPTAIVGELSVIHITTVSKDPLKRDSF